MKRFFLLLLLIMLAMPALASAHAVLLDSTIKDGAILDAPPADVTLSFSEPLDPQASTIELYDENSVAIGLERITFPAADQMQAPLPATLRPSSYTLIYHVLSAVDGHTSSGFLLFSIGTGAVPVAPSVDISKSNDASPNPLIVIAKAMQLVAGMIVVGSLIWLIVLLMPSLRQHDNERGAFMVRRTIWLIQWALMFMLIGTAWEFALRTKAIGTGSLDIEALTDMASNRWGTLALVRMAITLILMQLVFLIVRRRFMAELALGLSSLIMLTFSLSGHAAATPEPFTPISMDWMHQLTAAAWFGGLIGFTSVYWWLRNQSAEQRNPLLAWLIARFSPLALFSIALVSLTGTMRAFDQIPSLNDLWQSNYGRILLIKLGVLLGALLLGAWHWRKINPRMQAAASNNDVIKTGRTLMLESSLAIGVVLITGLLTQTPHPVANAITPTPTTANPQQAVIVTTTPRVAQPISLTATQSDLTMRLTLDDQRPGNRLFTAAISDTNGLITPDRVRLRFQSLDLETGQQIAIMEQQPDKRYMAQTGALSLLGKWQIEMQVRRLNQPDVTATWTVEMVR